MACVRFANSSTLGVISGSVYHRRACSEGIKRTLTINIHKTKPLTEHRNMCPARAGWDWHHRHPCPNRDMSIPKPEWWLWALLQLQRRWFALSTISPVPSDTLRLFCSVKSSPPISVRRTTLLPDLRSPARLKKENARSHTMRPSNPPPSTSPPLSLSTAQLNSQDRPLTVDSTHAASCCGHERYRTKKITGEN